VFVNKHVLDVIVVVVISSVCYIDHLLCYNFSGSKPSGFLAQKKKRRKLASKGKVKCGRRARPNGLASRVEHHLVKGKKGNRLCKHRIQHLFLPQERNNRGTKTAKQTEEGGNEETA